MHTFSVIFSQRYLQGMITEMALNIKFITCVSLTLCEKYEFSKFQ